MVDITIFPGLLNRMLKCFYINGACVGAVQVCSSGGATYYLSNNSPYNLTMVNLVKNFLKNILDRILMQMVCVCYSCLLKWWNH